MQRNIKRIVSGFLLIMLLISFMTGCNNYKSTWSPFNSMHVINIAVMGNEEVYHSDMELLKGIEMAVSDVMENIGVKVNVVFYNDSGDYVIGVENAQAIAKDNDFAYALTLQDFEIIDMVADIFNQEEKPLIALQGCYDSTSEKGYNYFLADFISATQMGEIMGEYAVSHGIKNIVACHSDTAFEKDELKGMQAYLKQYDGAEIINTQVGPFTKDEFNQSYSIWETLDADAVYLNFYEDNHEANIIKLLKGKNSKVVVMSDYGIYASDVFEEYEQYMDNVVIAPLYPYNQSEKLTEFRKDFHKRYGFTANEEALQAYDIITQLCSYSNDDFTSSLEFIHRMKSENGYQGVAGIIRFDEKGRLVVDNPGYLEFKDGEFISAGK